MMMEGVCIWMALEETSYTRQLDTRTPKAIEYHHLLRFKPTPIQDVTSLCADGHSYR